MQTKIIETDLPHIMKKTQSQSYKKIVLKIGHTYFDVQYFNLDHNNAVVKS